MSPQLERSQLPSVEILKIGGSLLFLPDSPHLNCGYIDKLLRLLTSEFTAGYPIVAVVGGGQLARIRERDARCIGIEDNIQLDQIGIGVTRNNARLLTAACLARQLPAKLLSRRDRLKTPVRSIVFCGGTIPGHTTDYVAVEAAVTTGQNIVFVLSNIEGIHPMSGAQILNQKPVIETLTLEAYLETIAQPHRPGIHTPIDQPAAQLAKEYGITLVVLGSDLNNLGKCLHGEKFRGTVLSP